LAQGNDLFLEGGEVEFGCHLALHLFCIDFSQIGSDLILFQQLHCNAEIIVVDVFSGFDAISNGAND
jgi:hypothetical protein